MANNFRENFLDKFLVGIDPPYKDYIFDSHDEIKSEVKKSKKFTDVKRDGVPVVEQFLEEEYKHPAAYYFAMRVQYGKEWINWEPETIEQTMNNDFIRPIDKFDKNIIGAIKALLKNSKFYSDYRVFGWTTYAFNKQIPKINIIPKPYPGTVFDTFKTAPLIRPGLYQKEVKDYIREVLKDFGVKGIPQLMEVNHLDEESRNVLKSYLNMKKNEDIDELIDYLKDNDKEYLLKTIGMIDYHLARLKLGREQLSKLQAGVIHGS